MTYTVQFLAEAERNLLRLPKPFRTLVRAKIEGLAQNPRPSQAKPLVNSGGRWRLRVGDYRVIYFIRDDKLLILVVTLGHRKDVYR